MEGKPLPAPGLEANRSKKEEKRSKKPTTNPTTRAQNPIFFFKKKNSQQKNNQEAKNLCRDPRREPWTLVRCRREPWTLFRSGGFVVFITHLSGHRLLRRAPRRAMPHPAVGASVHRLLHGPLPAAGPEPQLQVSAAPALLYSIA
jgi:hypothetical protein